MAVRRLSGRYADWATAEVACRLAPRLRNKMLFYRDAVEFDAISPAVCEVACEIAPILGPEAAELARIAGMPSVSRRLVSLHELRHVVVHGRTSAVVDPARGVVLHARDARAAVTYHTARWGFPAIRDKRGGPYFNFVGGRRGHGHFYHFLFDRLPKLYYLLEVFQPGRPVTVVTNSDLGPLEADALAELAGRYPHVSINGIPPGEAWRFDTLLEIDYGQAIKRSFAEPAVLEFLRGLYLGRYAAVPEPRRRLYVSRADAKLRRVVNEDALLPILARHGVEVVTPARMGLADQVRLFAEAELIVGTHGAGLSHALWPGGGAALVEMLPSNRIRMTFALLAAALGQPYWPIVGGPGGRREAYGVDPQALEETLERWRTRARDEAGSHQEGAPPRPPAGGREAPERE